MTQLMKECQIEKKKFFNLGAPKVIETIRKDYEESQKERGDLFFKKLFDF